MKKQIDLEDAIKTAEQKQKTKIKKPDLWSSCCPYREPVPYIDNEPSLCRTEFADECDINKIMKRFEATGVIPAPGREPIYWDSENIPNNLQDAMAGMMYANELFMQLPAAVRKEFDNDAVQFVAFASDEANKSKLKEWGLTAPETLPDAPVRVEVVTPHPPQPQPPGEPPKAS